MDILITDIGAKKLAESVSGGARLVLAKFAVGDGADAPTTAQTTLHHEVWRADINAVLRDVSDNGDLQMTLQCVVPESAGGFWVREIGIFDEDGDLILVAALPETWKSLEPQRRMVIWAPFTVNNGESVSVIAPPPESMATRAYVDAHIGDQVAHITAAERDDWNSKAPGNHTHSIGQLSGVLATTAPLALNATAVVGTTTTAARADHRHPFPTKANIGLGNVDNTSDAGKPISTATQTALDAKADTSDLAAHIDDEDAHVTTADRVNWDNKADTAIVALHISDSEIHVTAADKTTWDGMLPKTGGTMTGALTLSADPTSAMHAATKQYVDTQSPTASLLSSDNTWTGKQSFGQGAGINNIYAYCKPDTASNQYVPTGTGLPIWAQFYPGNDTKCGALVCSYNTQQATGQPLSTWQTFFRAYAGNDVAKNDFLKGIDAYGTIDLTEGAAAKLNQYLSDETTNKVVNYPMIRACPALDNTTTAIDALGFSHSIRCALSSFGSTNGYFPGQSAIVVSGDTLLDGSIHKAASSGRTYVMAFGRHEGFRIFENSRQSTGPLVPGTDSFNAWGDQTHDADIITKKYLDNLQFVKSNDEGVYYVGASGCSGGGWHSGMLGCKDNQFSDQTAYSAAVASRDCTSSGDFIYSAFLSALGCQASSDACVVVSGRNVVNQVSYSYAMGYASSGDPSAANRKIELNFKDGTVKATGTITNGATFTDYAEYFENKTRGVIPLGTVVALDGRFVKPAGDGDDLLGIVSGTAAVASGDSPFTWSKRFLTGEFGELLYEEIPDPAWEAKIPDPAWQAKVPYSAAEPRIPDPYWLSEVPDPDWTPVDGQSEADRPMIPNPQPQREIDNPFDYLVDNPQPQALIDNPRPQPMVRVPKEHPDFDPTQDNIPRAERPAEWTCVGLMGQLHVRVDATVTAGCWVKAADGGVGTASTTETRLKCMEIRQPFDADKGYAVAFCLLR